MSNIYVIFSTLFFLCHIMLILKNNLSIGCPRSMHFHAGSIWLKKNMIRLPICGPSSMHFHASSIWLGKNKPSFPIGCPSSMCMHNGNSYLIEQQDATFYRQAPHRVYFWDNSICFDSISQRLPIGQYSSKCLDISLWCVFAFRAGSTCY